METIKRVKSVEKNKILNKKSIKNKNIIVDVISKYITPNIPKLFFSIGAGIKFIVAPIFTAKNKKTGKLEFKAPYLYVFLLMMALFVSIGQLVYMIHQVAFGEVNEPVPVLTACGAQVATMIVVIDRMLKAYNEGSKNGNGHEHI